MGKRGPKPKPTKLLHSWRRNLRKDEVQTVGTPLKPAYLGRVASQKWNEVFKQLSDLGILGQIDSTTLARYCQLWALYQKTFRVVNKSGITKKNKSQTVALFKLAENLSRLEQMFGMTPSSRAGLKIVILPPPQPEDLPTENIESILKRQRNLRLNVS